MMTNVNAISFINEVANSNSSKNTNIDFWMKQRETRGSSLNYLTNYSGKDISSMADKLARLSSLADGFNHRDSMIEDLIFNIKESFLLNLPDINNYVVSEIKDSVIKGDVFCSRFISYRLTGGYTVTEAAFVLGDFKFEVEMGMTPCHSEISADRSNLGLGSVIEDIRYEEMSDIHLLTSPFAADKYSEDDILEAREFLDNHIPSFILALKMRNFGNYTSDLLSDASTLKALTDTLM